MNASDQKTVLVTGASAGIGKATAKVLHEVGFNVYACARRVEKMDDLKAMGVKPIRMDVTDEGSMEEGIHQIEQEAGGVDILVNNAGYGSYGAVEDVDMDEARRQFEVNVFGLARLSQLVLPHMREAGFGKIVNVTSVGGKIYSPMGGWYHATKHAVEGLSDCMRNEVKGFGVDVIVVEPGAIATEWSGIASKSLVKTSGKSAYREQAELMVKMLDAAENHPKVSKPKVIGDVILKAVTDRRPRTRYVAGYMAKTILRMRKFLPDKTYDRVFLAMMKRFIK
ncbi:putative oxidoreductase [Poriferisphaera corsica]|uniref:Putative oxidoreductase n=1 Tax=Poriferisphaera corsica TaxID=2528020 RepID=A0A517YYP5_9BACT|nr:oxidoreductase [Poriferisphaera corsica]QDU35341.1 putative oxidoreductase [Poriferisphaera corsica]